MATAKKTKLCLGLILVDKNWRKKKQNQSALTKIGKALKKTPNSVPIKKRHQNVKISSKKKQQQ